MNAEELLAEHKGHRQDRQALYEVGRKDLQVSHVAQRQDLQSYYQDLQSLNEACRQDLQALHKVYLTFPQQMVKRTKEPRNLIAAILMAIVTVVLAVIPCHHM